jgi:hypothetical protein
MAQNLSYATPEDAEPYHQRVRQAVAQVPYAIGDWRGADREIPEEVTRMLKPNAIVSRGYRNEITGRRVTLWVVHCRDARDMGCHYPPVCYRASGWELRQSRPVLSGGGGEATVEAVEYEFTKRQLTWSDVTYAVNVLLLPDGTITPMISEVYKAAADYQRRYWGAGQVQLVFGEGTPAAERDEVFRTFANGLQAVMKTIGSGQPGKKLSRQDSRGKQ